MFVEAYEWNVWLRSLLVTVQYWYFSFLWNASLEQSTYQSGIRGIKVGYKRGIMGGV